MPTKSLIVLVTAAACVASAATATPSPAKSCTASTKKLALGYSAPGACVVQVQCGGVCSYRLSVEVNADFTAPGRITGKATWSWLSPKFSPTSTRGTATCTAYSGFQTHCSELAIVDVFAKTALRVVCTIPAGLVPVRYVSARVTCSLAG